MLQPIVPKRPGKKKTESLELERHDPNSEMESPSTPEIPKRPVKSNSEEFQKEESPMVPPRPKSKYSTLSEPDLMIDESRNGLSQVENREPINHESPIQENSTGDSRLNQNSISADDGEDGDDEGDGDKTPGNTSTKSTFKGDISEENSNNSGLSSFNDDQVTVLQDADQERVENRHTQDSEFEDLAGDSASNDGFVSEVMSASQPRAKNDGTRPKDDSTSMPIIPQRPKPLSRLLRSSIEPLSAKETDGDGSGDGIPSIPKRSLKKEEDTKTIEDTGVSHEHHEKEAKEEGTSVSTGSEQELESKSEVDVGEKADSKSPVKRIAPSIPSRPSKPFIALRPGNHAKSSDSDKMDASDKPKAPPPKPKKLSSKIAAFQDMLNKPQDSGSGFNATNSKIPQGERESDSELLTGPSSKGNKLSSSHMKFAQNLQGIMGRGFALPGMANPADLGQSAESNGAGTGNDDEEVKKTSQVSRQDPVRRAKGPRGKRLPKNLSTPVKIETNPKFQIVGHGLWSLEFKRVSLSDKQLDSNDENYANEADINKTAVGAVTDDQNDNGYDAVIIEKDEHTLISDTREDTKEHTKEDTKEVVKNHDDPEEVDQHAEEKAHESLLNSSEEIKYNSDPESFQRIPKENEPAVNDETQVDKIYSRTENDGSADADQTEVFEEAGDVLHDDTATNDDEKGGII